MLKYFLQSRQPCYDICQAFVLPHGKHDKFAVGSVNGLEPLVRRGFVWYLLCPFQIMIPFCVNVLALP